MVAGKLIAAGVVLAGAAFVAVAPKRHAPQQAEQSRAREVMSLAVPFAQASVANAVTTELLGKILATESQREQKACYDAIRRQGDVAALVAVLRGNDTPELKAVALNALAGMRKDLNDDVRALMSDTATQLLFGCATRSVREDAMAVLYGLGSASTSTLVRFALTDLDGELRSRALALVSSRLKPGDAAALVDVATNSSVPDGWRFETALASLPAATPEERARLTLALLETARWAARCGGADRAAALRLYARLDADGCRHELPAMLSSQDDGARCAALRTLSELSWTDGDRQRIAEIAAEPHPSDAKQVAKHLLKVR